MRPREAWLIRGNRLDDVTDEEPSLLPGNHAGEVFRPAVPHASDGTARVRYTIGDSFARGMSFRSGRRLFAAIFGALLAGAFLFAAGFHTRQSFRKPAPAMESTPANVSAPAVAPPQAAHAEPGATRSTALPRAQVVRREEGGTVYGPHTQGSAGGPPGAVKIHVGDIPVYVK